MLTFLPRAEAIQVGLLPDDYELPPSVCDESNNFGLLVDETADELERVKAELTTAHNQLLWLRAKYDLPMEMSVIAGIRAREWEMAPPADIVFDTVHEQPVIHALSQVGDFLELAA